MPLTDAKVKNAKPLVVQVKTSDGEKPQTKQAKLSDGHGMYLLVTASGGKCWRYKYRFEGKEKTLALGTYPEIPLEEARQRCFEARALLQHGADPSAAKKAKKQAQDVDGKNTFEAIAREWHAKFLANKSASYRTKMLASFERDVFPWLGKRPIAAIKAPELLTVLQRIESRGALETAHRTRSACSQVFRFAIATARGDRDCAADLLGALPPYRKGHRAAITDPEEAAKLLRCIDGYKGTFVVQSALRLAPYVFARPTELRHAEWTEIDFEKELWSIAAEKMKMRDAHVVPLSRQALQILRDLQPVTGHSRYIFPCVRSKQRSMSENTVLGALRRMGYGKEEMCGHGFRAMARTLLDEVMGVRVDYIEQQLSHQVKDALGRAYNRTKYLPQRRKMMQLWANYLDALKTGDVLPVADPSLK